MEKAIKVLIALHWYKFFLIIIINIVLGTQKIKKNFLKKSKNKNIKKNDMIFWKGHVAIALSKNKLIHAYGPMKKVVIMNKKKKLQELLIYKTIK